MDTKKQFRGGRVCDVIAPTPPTPHTPLLIAHVMSMNTKRFLGCRLGSWGSLRFFLGDMPWWSLVPIGQHFPFPLALWTGGPLAKEAPGHIRSMSRKAQHEHMSWWERG